VRDSKKSGIRVDAILLAALSILAGLVLSRLFYGRFTNYDDDWQIYNNPYVRGLTAENLKGMFTMPIHGMYLPIKTLSYAVDYSIWGYKAFGFRLTSFILFLLSAYLLYVIIRILFKSRAGAFFGTLIFIVHPVHVEVVGWLSARKDVLALFFFLLAFLLFILYRRALDKKSRRGGVFFFILSCLSFVLAMGSKSTAASLPLALFLYDCIFHYKSRKDLKLFILDKIPFLILGALGAFWTLHLARELQFVRQMPYASLLPRMVKVFACYIWLLIAPVKLCVQYLILPVKDFLSRNFLLSAATLVVFIVAAVISFKKSKLIFFCLMWFLINFIPVSHLVPINVPSLMADRYIYTSSLALSFLVALGIARRRVLDEKFGEDSVVHVVLVLLLGGFLIFCSIQTVRRTGVWKDSFTLWQSELGLKSLDAREIARCRSRNYNAFHNLGAALLEREKVKKRSNEPVSRQNLEVAEKLFFKAVALKSDYILSLLNIADIYILQGKFIDGMELLDNVVAIKPGGYMSGPTVRRVRARAHFLRGYILSKKGFFNEALKEYENAAELNGGLWEVYYNAARTLLDVGDEKKADEYLEKMRRANPEFADRVEELLRGIKSLKAKGTSAIIDALQQYVGSTKEEAKEAYENYQEGLKLYRAEEYSKALYHFQEAARIAPKFDSAHAFVGGCYYRLGRVDAATGYLEEKAAKLPKSSSILLVLGEIYVGQDKLKEAEKAFKTVLGLNPKLEKAYLDLSTVYWRQGELSKARAILETALERFGQRKEIIERLRVMELHKEWGK